MEAEHLSLIAAVISIGLSLSLLRTNSVFWALFMAGASALALLGAHPLLPLITFFVGYVVGNFPPRSRPALDDARLWAAKLAGFATMVAICTPAFIEFCKEAPILPLLIAMIGLVAEALTIKRHDDRNYHDVVEVYGDITLGFSTAVLVKAMVLGGVAFLANLVRESVFVEVDSLLAGAALYLWIEWLPMKRPRRFQLVRYLASDDAMPRIDLETAQRKALEHPEAKRIYDRPTKRPAYTINFGYVPIPEKLAAENNFLVTGAAGSGKTLAIRMLMQDVLSHIGDPSTPKTRVVIYDHKRVPNEDAYNLLMSAKGIAPNAPLHILNPLDARAEPWDIAADVDGQLEADAIAKTFIPPATGNEEHWKGSAGDILGAAMLALSHRNSGNWTFRDLLLATSNLDAVEDLLLECPETAGTAKDHLSGSENTRAGHASTLRRALRPYAPMAAGWHLSQNRPFSFRNFIKNEEGIVVISHDTEAPEPFSVLNNAMINRLMQLALSQTEGETWFILDELAVLNRLDQLAELLLTGRDKGCRVVLGFQNVSSLFDPKSYGRYSGDAILGECKNRAYFWQPSDPSGEWASKELKDLVFVEQTRHGQNYEYVSHKKDSERRVPAEFLQKALRESHYGEGNSMVCDVAGIGVWDVCMPWERMSEFLAPIPSHAQYPPFVDHAEPLSLEPWRPDEPFYDLLDEDEHDRNVPRENGESPRAISFDDIPPLPPEENAEEGTAAAAEPDAETGAGEGGIQFRTQKRRRPSKREAPEEPG